jgi:hypothetical protein
VVKSSETSKEANEHAGQLAVVLEHVDHISQELQLLYAHIDAALQRIPVDVALLRRLMSSLECSVASLRRQAIAGGGEHSRELALRARINVVVGQIQQLADARGELDDIWPSGRFKSMTDVAARILRGFAEVLSAASTNHLDAAEHAMEVLARDADLACFIGAGASLASARVRLACRTIAAMFDIALASEQSIEFPSRVAKR